MFDDRYNGVTLDEAAAEAGGYVNYYPGKKFVMDYDYHAATIYCREKGIRKTDLTEEEWSMFELNPPLVFPREKGIQSLAI